MLQDDEEDVTAATGRAALGQEGTGPVVQATNGTDAEESNRDQAAAKPPEV